MACGKKSNNAPTEEFILESPAPVDVAAKISAIYRELSEKVKFFFHKFQLNLSIKILKWKKRRILDILNMLISYCRKKSEPTI